MKMVKCGKHRTNKEGDFEIWEEDERQSQAWTRQSSDGREGSRARCGCADAVAGGCNIE